MSNRRTERLWSNEPLLIFIRVRIKWLNPTHGYVDSLGDFAPCEVEQILEAHGRRFGCPDNFIRFSLIDSRLETVSAQN